MNLIVVAQKIKIKSFLTFLEHIKTFWFRSDNQLRYRNVCTSVLVSLTLLLPSIADTESGDFLAPGSGQQHWLYLYPAFLSNVQVNGQETPVKYLSGVPIYQNKNLLTDHRTSSCPSPRGTACSHPTGGTQSPPHLQNNNFK